jgi:hypothetical protein
VATHHYRGWRSTKLHLALVTMALATGAYAFTGFHPELYGEYTMALIAAAGMYSGAAAAEKFAGPRGKVDAP